MNAKQIWHSALERIQQMVSQAAYKTWFHGTRAVSLNEDVLTVGVQSTFRRDHLENRFEDLVCSVLSHLIGPGAKVCFVIAPVEETDQEQLDAFAPADDLLIFDAEVWERPWEAVGELEEARTRRTTLMAASPSRRERLEAAQSGRRLPRRVASYAGPALLPAAEWSAPAPLLAQLPSPADGLASDGRADNTPTSLFHEAPSAEEPGRMVIVEAAGPLPRVRDEDWTAPDRPIRALPATRFEEPATLASDPDDEEESEDEESTSGGEGTFNRRYTFSSFIVGKSNQLAHAGALSIFEKSPDAHRRYNPLFLFGGVGLGKTHLLHAIGHRGLAEGLTVLYTTSDRFTNEIINAIRYHTTEEFRAKYRQIDILLVDDVQFIAGKESTEEEFFHTFNALHNAGKQIVLTSDRVPKAMVTLQDRLRSRFEWGLLADIQPPEYEHRLAILRSKAERLHLEIDDAVITFLATPECNSIRELEGTLNRAVAYAKLHAVTLTVKVAMEALDYVHADHRTHALDPQEILEVVARHYRVTLEALRGKERDRAIVWPRQMAMYLMRDETKANFKEIAAFLARRDHTTIIHGVKRISKAIGRDERVRKEVAALRDELRLLVNPQEGKDD